MSTDKKNEKWSQIRDRIPMRAWHYQTSYCGD